MSSLSSMIEQVKKLKNGVGVQSLLDSAYEILGNPLAMFNTEYTLLAYTDVESDDPWWNELITLGTFSHETQKFFEEEGYIEDIANGPRVAHLNSEKVKYARLNGKVYNKNNSYVSNLILVASNKPLEEGDIMVFEIICKLVSREISKNEFYQVYEQVHQETLIKSLIDGTYDKKLDLAQMSIIYDTLGTNLYIAVADFSQCDSEKEDIEHFRDVLKKFKPAYKYARYSDYLVIIISTNEDNLNADKEFKELIKFFGQNSIYAGISTRFENLFEFRKHYERARKALGYVLDVRCNQCIFPCCPDSMEKMEQITKLKNGEGIQYFLNLGAEIFGNPLIFHDMEANLLGYTECMEIADPIWQEMMAYGTASDDTIELFKTAGWIDIMDNTRGGALLVSERCKYDRISWRIYNSDNIRIGCTSIVNSKNPFSEDELVLFGAFSQKFSKEVGKIEFYNNYGQVYSGTIINRLLSGRIDDYTFYSEDIGNLYDNLMSYLYLVVVDTGRYGSEQFNLTFFRDLFNRQNTVNRYAIYEKYIIVIISTDTPLDKDNEFEEISRVFLQHNIYAGISSCFENIHDLKTYYIEAVSALNAGIESKDAASAQRLFQYRA